MAWSLGSYRAAGSNPHIWSCATCVASIGWLQARFSFTIEALLKEVMCGLRLHGDAAWSGWQLSRPSAPPHLSQGCTPRRQPGAGQSYVQVQMPLVSVPAKPNEAAPATASVEGLERGSPLLSTMNLGKQTGASSPGTAPINIDRHLNLPHHRIGKPWAAEAAVSLWPPKMPRSFQVPDPEEPRASKGPHRDSTPPSGMRMPVATRSSRALPPNST